MTRIRAQVVIILAAVAILVGVVGYLALSASTETVADYGGTYIEGVVGNPEYINPLLSHSNQVDQDLVALIFTGLTRPDGRGQIIPDLAEHWEVSTDGRVYTFYLRQDVVWHDGAAFTADDAVFTFTLVQQPEFPGSKTLADLWRNVVVEKLDEYTVRFTLREPFAPFLDYTTIGILPVHILGGLTAGFLPESKFNTEPVGTGPFRLEEISATRVILTSNADFYRGRPYLDRIEFVFYEDSAAIIEARSRGEVQGIAQVPPQYLSAVHDDRDLALYTAPLSGYNAVYLNLDRGTFQDPAVRQAMMWALDRQRLVNNILAGQGIVVHSPIMPHSWAYDPNVTRYEHDLKKAIALLEGRGWFDDDEDGVRERAGVRLQFTLITNDDPQRVRLAEAISEQLAAAGIKAIPEAVPWEELRDSIVPLRRYDALLLGIQRLPSDPDPYPYWHSSQAGETGLNLANWNNATADALLEAGRLRTSQEDRYALYRDFQDLFAREVPSLLLYQPVYNYAVSDKVRGIQLGPLVTPSDRFASVLDWYVATQQLIR